LKYKPDDSETKRKLDTVRTKVNMLFKFEEKSCFGIIRKKKQYENWNMDQIYRRICNRMFEIELWLEIRVFFFVIDLRTINDCPNHQEDENHR
jgi:hypothetical protein